MQEYQTSLCNCCCLLWGEFLCLREHTHTSCVSLCMWKYLQPALHIDINRVVFHFEELSWWSPASEGELKLYICITGYLFALHPLLLLSSHSLCVFLSLNVFLCLCLYCFFSLPCGCYDYKIVVGTMKGILENVKGSVHLNNKKRSILSLSSTAFQICKSFDFFVSVLARRYFSVATSHWIVHTVNCFLLYEWS